MKARNQRIWSDDLEFLKRLADEQQNYIGREYRLDLKRGLLTIFALPQPKKKDEKVKRERDKRSEKFERRNS